LNADFAYWWVIIACRFTVMISMLNEFPGYVDGLKKGLPLFTNEELATIKEKYQKGLTWEDIDMELSNKGFIFKKPTFRKYIQEGNISKAIGYKNSANGRVAIFPADTISHINLIQYFYKVMDGKHVDNVMKIIGSIATEKESYLEAIESYLFHGNIYASLYHRICFGDGDIDEAIKEALESRPAEIKKYIKLLDNINDKFDKVIGKEIGKFVDLLKNNHLNIMETIVQEEEKGDAQN